MGFMVMTSVSLHGTPTRGNILFVRVSAARHWNLYGIVYFGFIKSLGLNF
jgi:hypothetical protein